MRGGTEYYVHLYPCNFLANFMVVKMTISWIKRCDYINRYFFLFCSKYILWVRIRTMSMRPF